MVKKVVGVDVGYYRFGGRSDVTIQEIAFEACRDSVKDAQIEQEDTSLSVIGKLETRLYELMPVLPIKGYVGLEGNDQYNLKRLEQSAAPRSTQQVPAESLDK